MVLVVYLKESGLLPLSCGFNQVHVSVHYYREHEKGIGPPASRATMDWVSKLLSLMILVVLATVAYIPALQLPFIDDDYGEIPLAASYFSNGWTPLWQNPNLRARATNMWLDGALDHTFGFTPVPFYAVSILVHTLCSLLIYAFCTWGEILDETTAFWSACFFAIFEGHQEAVMWISARNESLVFLFGMAAWVCWVKYLRERSALWYGLAIVSLVFAAGSKESFVIFPVLMLLPCIWPPAGTSRRRALISLLPFFAIVVAYLAWTWLDRIAQPQYSDNRFSFWAPWPLVILKSWWRMMFVWGLAALAIVVWIGRAADRRKACIAIAWMLLAIFPYSFLTYMPQIASRHTYIASAGLALLVGAAAARLRETNRRVLLGAAALAVLAMNLEIIWVKKMSQFRERAEPAVLLREAAREAAGPIAVGCIPYPDFMTQAVLATSGSHAIFPQPVTYEDHCFKVEYDNSAGAHIRIDRRIRTASHGAFH